MSDNKVQIAFKGTEEYRFQLQERARQRRMTVQDFLEAAVAAYLQTPADQTPKRSPEIEQLVDWWNNR